MNARWIREHQFGAHARDAAQERVASIIERQAALAGGIVRSRTGAPRRWELTPEEWERVRARRSRGGSISEKLRLLTAAPRLIPEVVEDIASSVRAAPRDSSALLWLLDSQRVRQAVPDAARSVGFSDEAPFLRMLLPRLNKSQRVLELGCGDGRISRHVLPRVAELTCSDISRTMLAEARENLVAHANVRFFRARGYTLWPLPDASVDVVFAQGVLSWLDVNVGLALLDEVRRVLRPSGTSVINAFTFDDDKGAGEQVRMVRETARRGRFNAGIARTYTEHQVKFMHSACGLNTIEAGYSTDDPSVSAIPYTVVSRASARDTGDGATELARIAGLSPDPPLTTSHPR